MKNNYFNQLNYSLANEDSRVEFDILTPDLPHVVAVAGSGSRVLPLLSKRPKIVTVIDLSPEQLALCELRVESLRILSHSEFLQFWGYTPNEMNGLIRQSFFHSLSLRPESRKFLSQEFEKMNWNPILYQGRWEKTFNGFSKLAHVFLGRSWIEGLFECRTLQEQSEYLAKDFPLRRWKLLLALIGNARTFNTLLYRGSFPKKNIPGNLPDFYFSAFDRLFRQGPARQNHFLQLCFLGKVLYQEGAPLEADSQIFESAKHSLEQTEVRYECSDLIHWMSRTSEVSFLSLSNIVSYFQGETEKRYLQELRKGLSDGATVIIRNYLRIPENTDRTGFADRTAEFQDLLSREKTQMYTIEVLEKTP